jgi:hypothetical protein
MGTLGSQIANNLIRAGFGTWYLIDDDVLLPHNCARHLLASNAVGFSKVQASKYTLNQVLDDERIVEAIPANILRPDGFQEIIDEAITESEILLDFSASVAVSRAIACRTDAPRSVCAFITPMADCLVIEAEDRNREFKLDWLEMVHYREVIHNEELSETLNLPGIAYRHGNSCRDVTSTLAQDNVAIWAGIASRSVKHIVPTSCASVKIWKIDADGSIKYFEPNLYPLLNFSLDDWTIQLDQWIVDKISQLRDCSLPNETGGVLLGSFDTQSKRCAIIDIIPSPIDSEEWPTSYIRGSSGIQKRIDRVENQTLGHIGYVGEWHSHPSGASGRPSRQDIGAFNILKSQMCIEDLPAILLICAEKKQIVFVKGKRC